jgi:uncharacterized membrane protein/Leucine-rich repeat (LRR) protein
MKNLIPDKFVPKINWLQLLSFVGVLMWSSLALADTTNCSAVNEIPTLECEALVALYNSTNGPNWYDNQTNNWNKTNTPCSWEGVECSGRYVTAITRENKRLVGTLPDLSALTSLQKFDLGSYWWGCWSCKNQLKGTLPDLSALTQLTTLDLSYNQFKGNIETSSLPTSLTSLNLEENRLEGAIPHWTSFSNLTTLNLGDNSLKEPVDPCPCFPTSLQSLSLYGTQLNQSLPDLGLSDLPNLTSLDLSSAKLSGTILASHFSTSLTFLNLSYNYLLNQLLPDFSTLTNLITLDLSYSSLNGPVKLEFFPSSLRYLYSYNTQFSGSIPNFKDRNFDNLIYIDLSYNYQLEGDIECSLFPEDTLQTLYLNETSLNQPLPDLNCLSELINLGLSNTGLNGPIDPTYLPDEKLSYLYLHDNQLNGPFPNLGGFNNLSYLDISNNQLSGPLDASLLPNSLGYFDSSNNQLNGPLPDLSGFSNLSYLNIADNQLSGPIETSFLPSSWFLWHLDLSGNHLTGAIPNLPSSIGVLRLNNNQFSGIVPNSLINLNLCSQSLDSSCWEYSDLGYNHLKVPASTEVTTFLEEPGNKDPDWASTQSALLLTCFEGGSLGIQSVGFDSDTGEFNFGTKIVNSTISIDIKILAQDCGSLQVDSIEFLGPDTSEFNYNEGSKSCWRNNHPRSSTCRFTVTWSPLDLGIKEATLKFFFTDPNVNKELSIQAEAVLSGKAKISIDPQNHDFGEITIGESSAIQEFLFENSGKLDLRLDYMGLTEDRANFFFYDWSCAYTNVLFPAQACNFGAQFIPILEGEKQAKILISSPDTPSKKVKLRGTAKVPEECLDENITIESAGSGNWDDVSTWSTGTIPNQADNVRIKRTHTITGMPYATVKALCIDQQGSLKSFDNQGTHLILHAENYLQNKGVIRGKNGADETGYTPCTGNYWSVIGKSQCAQPGAGVILSVGDGSKSLFRNEGVIIAGHGGKGKQYGAYGGGVSIYGGSFINTATRRGSGGIIIAGKGGDITDNLPGRAGRGGDLSGSINDYLHHYGEVQIAAGNGGNCNGAAGQMGGNGGDLRLAAPSLVRFVGGEFSAGQGGINCYPNGAQGSILIEPSVISLAGASTKIEGGNITIFGGDDWVLDLSNAGATLIKATGNITLAVGEGGVINLKNNRGVILEAGGQVNLFSDAILLDENVKQQSDLLEAALLNSGMIKAAKIKVWPSKILYDVSLTGSGKHTGEPGTILPISLTLVNGGPATDTYTLQVTDPKGWVAGQIGSPIEVAGLKTQKLPLEVALPNEPGEINTITVTATSQADPTVKAVAEIQVAVAQATIYAVTLTAATNQWFGDPSSTLSIPLTLTNKGNEIDTYTLKVVSPENWAMELSPTTIPLGISASADLNLNVTLPAEAGAKSVITITATSQADPSVIEEMLLTVGTTSHDFAFTTTPSQISDEPSTTLPVELELTNLGSSADNYEIEVTDNPDNLLVSGLPTTLSVEISETKRITPEITLPTEPGATNSLTITATSQNDPTVKKVVLITSSVTGTGENNSDSQSSSSEVTPTPLPIAAATEDEETATSATEEAADETTVSPDEVTQTTVISDISGLTACPPTGEIDYLCRNYGNTLTNADLGTDAKVAGGELAGIIDNQGIVSQVTIQPDTLLKGGWLTGYIVNQGTLADFTFVGAQVEGGTLAGIITNNSQVGGTFINVHLAENTHLTGGNVQGTISGEAAAPALLEELTVKANSHLSFVTIGKNVQLENPVTFGNGVQFTNPAEDPRPSDAHTVTTTSPSSEDTTVCDTELPQLGAIATNSQGKTVTTTAYIAGGAATATSETFQRELTISSSSESVKIHATFCVEPQQVGQRAGFIAYAAYTAADSPDQKPSLYQLAANGQVMPWDGNFTNLTAFQEALLKPTQTLKVYQSKLAVPAGVIEIHVGYRLEDGTVTVNDKTIQITITN